jgi:hypothetical protein
MLSSDSKPTVADPAPLGLGGVALTTFVLSAANAGWIPKGGALPKTRSGKIMRRLLKEAACNGQVTGDTTTLEDYSVLAKLSGDGKESAS